MQRRLQFVVAPAHQHVADIAGDDSRQRFDVGPGEFGGFLSRAELEAALAGALMQQRQTIEIGVRAGAPAGEILGLGVDHR